MFTSDAYFRPLIPILVSLTVGILLGSQFSGHDIWAYSFVAISIFLIPVKLAAENHPIYKIKTNFINIFGPFILFAALGYISIQPWFNPQFPQNHVIRFQDTEKYTITGNICSVPETYSRRQRFILDVETIAKNKDKRSTTGRMRVTVYGKGPELNIGDAIKFRSKIKSIRNFNNPGGFDYQRYMAFQKIWNTAYTQGNRIDVIPRHSGASGWVRIEKYRKKIGTFIQENANENTTGLLRALVLGDKTGIPKDTRDVFNRAGVSHVLAISGLHIGIIATFFFIIFQTIISRFDIFLWNAQVKKIAAALTFFPVLVYGLLSGMSPSTQRAVIMVGLFLVTFLFDREQDSINTLALAAFAILVVHPPSLFSISFQLSFVTVFFIIYGLSSIHYLEAFFLKWDRLQIIKKIIIFVLVSFFAFLGSLPIIMFYFNQISTIGILANLFIIPLIGFVAVPLGLMAVFTYPVYTPLAMLCIKGSSYTIEKTISLVTFFSDLSFSAIKTFTPSIVEMVCFYVLVMTVMQVKKKRWMRYAAICIVVILFVDTAYWIHRRHFHDDFRITIIDVGQGSSALLEIPGGETMLIDGGGFSDNSYFDIGERVVGPLLWRKKIMTVNTLVLSHPNSDHLNGLIYIAKHFNVKKVWANGQSANTYGYRNFMKVINEEKIRTPLFEEIKRRRVLNGVVIEILYPEKDFMKKREHDYWRNRNNNSIALKASFNGTSILFPGDIEARGEIDLVSIAEERLKSDILVSPHHGSKSSSCNMFLDTINPEYVMISSGWRNRFGFPHPRILEKYEKRGYKIFRTDQCGAITITISSDALNIETVLDTE